MIVFDVVSFYIMRINWARSHLIKANQNFFLLRCDLAVAMPFSFVIPSDVVVSIAKDSSAETMKKYFKLSVLNLSCRVSRRCAASIFPKFESYLST